MANINRAPRYSSDIQDAAKRETVASVQSTARHVPFVYIQAPYGSTDVLRINADLTAKYGEDILNVRNVHYSPAVHGLERAIAAGNVCYAKRLVSENAKKAAARLAVEMVAADIPVYLRNADGTIQRNADGSPKEDGSNTVDGYILRWSIIGGATMGEFGAGAIVNGGTLVGRSGEVSNIYPILDLEDNFFGKAGDTTGFSLFPAISNLRTPVDRNVITFNNAMVYRLAFKRLNPTAGTTYFINALDGSQYTDFTFKEDAYNPKTNLDYNPSKIVSAFQNIDPTSGFEPTYGPVGRFHLYENNLNTVLELLKTSEEAATGTTIADSALINIMSAMDYEGAEYASFSLTGGVKLTAGNVHYLSGGDDGDVSFAKLGELIIADIDAGWEEPGNELRDELRFPITSLYDVGYKIETKYALARTLRLRPDITIAFSVEDLSVEQYTASEQDSVGSILAAYIASIPESIESGTGCCRAVIYAHSGYRSNDKYNKRLTIIDELISVRAKYMGANNGRFKTGYAYDTHPYNTLAGWFGINNTYRNEKGRENDWANGVNYCQFSDTNTLFIPARQTVYAEDSSPLNAEIPMIIAVALKSVGARVWTRMVNNTSLSPNQFLAECERLAKQDIDGAFDNRGSISVRAYFTEKDLGEGTTWHMDFRYNSGIAKTVAAFNIIVDRDFPTE